MAGDAPEPPADSNLFELFHSHERVPFVYWREFSGARVAVLATGAVAGLAFITGLSTLSQQTLALNGPLAGLLPGPSDVIRLLPILLSFLLVGVATGLQRRLRIAWYGALVGLPLLALFPLVVGTATGIPLLLGTAVTLPLVVRNRDAFDQSVDLGPFQTIALTVFFGVQIYGTVGAYALREQYVGIETWIDAFYFIVVTGTTVGYGDVTPTSQMMKLFTLSYVVLGTGAFGAVFGSLLVPAIESRITSAFGNMSASELTLLEDHVLILGYGSLTEPLLDELAASTDVVVITPDTDIASGLGERDVNVLTAEPTDDEVLLSAGAASASGVVVAMDDDPRSALAVIAARQANPDVRVVAAATDPGHVDKLEAVGADEVISPTVIGGQLLGRSVLGLPTAPADSGTDESDESGEVEDDAGNGTDDQADR